ncbi:hypothetical protein ALT1644_130079 [Alteromonas macleodii]|uniref:hypothetical protein n=1 Tax=Alteromonas sp. BZK5 TaxID=1904459 RepID=UPI001653C882|nr:hypothetical protein [Alteromonas sp. BZK5]MBC6987978.1 hypothetical protein [Alteromonas sp. BZK5]|tara:strand:- start:3726 stop:3956 length:231 start_codon:yes stop_codon:yes gene_type:complete
MFRFSEFILVKVLTNSRYLLIFDKRSGDTLALEYFDLEAIRKLLVNAHEGAFWKSALAFESISFNKAVEIGILVEV